MMNYKMTVTLFFIQKTNGRTNSKLILNDCLKLEPRNHGNHTLPEIYRMSCFLILVTFIYISIAIVTYVHNNKGSTSTYIENKFEQ